MSTLRVNTIQNAAGSGDPTLSGTAKAWVNFNGTGTVAIRQAFNVSSITDNGTGDYTVNMTNAMSDANYSAVCNGQRTSGASSHRLFIVQNRGFSATSSTFRLVTVDEGGITEDAPTVSVAIFR